MKRSTLTPWILVCVAAALTSAASAQTLIERTQLRRTVDPSERSATGTVLRKITSSGVETFQVQIKGLGEDQYSIYGGGCATFDTNCLVEGIALLSRTGVKNGGWSRKLTGKGQAPAEFIQLDITNLNSILTGQINIAQPSIPDIVTSITNIVGDVTNIVAGVTNIVGGVTNIVVGIPINTVGQTGFVFSTLWAPLRPMTTKPNLLSFNLSTNLSLPTVIVPPSPAARGTVKTRFVGPQGRSVLEIRATGLIQGQKYTVFIADQSTNTETIIMLPAGDMTTNTSGSEAQFIRDTRFADPLPQQAGNIEELTGRRIEIRDSYFDVHLESTIPGPTPPPIPDAASPTVSF